MSQTHRNQRKSIVGGGAPPEGGVRERSAPRGRGEEQRPEQRQGPVSPVLTSPPPHAGKGKPGQRRPAGEGGLLPRGTQLAVSVSRGHACCTQRAALLPCTPHLGLGPATGTADPGALRHHAQGWGHTGSSSERVPAGPASAWPASTCVC